jgi:hypothetical protein
MTASITAYSAISWPSSSHHNLRRCSIDIVVLSSQLNCEK